ncbi:MAG TPA: cytochrome C oxidase subunit IV family protein [Rhodanobacteraceae bacterium]|jgi:cytochrome o ubiquinol oxidase operon protein cyoD|nr:cytochrome C oxidase subunit IV family protein [Rhodanobacteraceae bacterium]
MSEQAQTREDKADEARQARREFLSYASGIALALALTLVPFWAVHWHALPQTALYIMIGAFALVQMVVHFRFFLHIGFRQKRDDLQLILFSALLLVIMIGGTLWIMGSLARRMVLP